MKSDIYPGMARDTSQLLACDIFKQTRWERPETFIASSRVPMAQLQKVKKSFQDSYKGTFNVLWCVESCILRIDMCPIHFTEGYGVVSLETGEIVLAAILNTLNRTCIDAGVPN